jgi:hypothetical protein
VPPLSHLNSCTPTKYLNISSPPSTNSHIHFHSLSHLSKESVQVQGLQAHFLGWGVVSHKPNRQVGGHPLSTVRDCLFNTFAATEQKLLLIKPENYSLTTQFSRTSNYGGGVCIYCKLDMDCNPIDITQYCMEKVIEACAARLNTGNNYFIILCIYRSPCGNVGRFIEQLELI